MPLGSQVVGTIENLRDVVTSIPERVTVLVEELLQFLQEVASYEIVTGAINTIKRAFETAFEAIKRALNDVRDYAMEAYYAFDFKKLIKDISRMVNRSIHSILKVTNDVRKSDAVRKANEYIDARLSEFKRWIKSFSEPSEHAITDMYVNPGFGIEPAIPKRRIAAATEIPLKSSPRPSKPVRTRPSKPEVRHTEQNAKKKLEGQLAKFGTDTKELVERVKAQLNELASAVA